MATEQIGAGPIALLGSGEYTPAMESTDRLLLEWLGGAPQVPVALIPAASGQEEGGPERWNQLGVQHFAALGAPAMPLVLASRDHAHDPQIVASLRQARLFYFSGGNPEYLVETLRDTPAWAAILAAHHTGAGIAGCSAGAMILGGHTLRVRSIVAGRTPTWLPAQAVLPELAIVPHFDRINSFVSAEAFQAILASAPAHTTLVGIDEDTALVRYSAAGPVSRWQVNGRQGVTIFNAAGPPAVYPAGAELEL